MARKANSRGGGGGGCDTDAATPAYKLIRVQGPDNRHNNASDVCHRNHQGNELERRKNSDAARVENGSRKGTANLSQTSPSSVLDHFDSVTGISSADKNALAKRETEFQLRLCSARKKALHLYNERIRLLEQHQQAQPRTGPPVSMEHNPASFFPCLCTPDGGSLGEARHWCMHRSHNLTELFV